MVWNNSPNKQFANSVLYLGNVNDSAENKKVNKIYLLNIVFNLVNPLIYSFSFKFISHYTDICRVSTGGD